MKPQEPIPHNYSMRGLNLIFAVSSLVLLAVTGLMVGYDYVRGWKWFQIEFMRIQQERIEQELTSAQKAENKGQLSKLDQQAHEQELVIARHRKEYVVAQKDLDEWEGKHYAADQDYRFTKATLDAKRYDMESAITQNLPDLKQRRKTFDDLSTKLHELDVHLQEVTRDRDAAKARVDFWLKNIKDAEDEKKKLTASIDLLNKQLATVAPTGPNVILNLPMLDFVSPTLKIDQVVLPDLYVAFNYMHVPRVDRCQTCHRAIDRTGF